MRSLIFIAAILCVVGTAICQTPPRLPEQFTTNFTLVLPGYVSPTDSPVFISGFFALDYDRVGAFMEIGGEEYVPLSFHTNIVASPNITQRVVYGYMYEGPLCWRYGKPIPAELLLYLPFVLPSYAQFVGNKVIAGQACTGWKLPYFVYNPPDVTVWVSNSTSTVVQIDVDNLEYFDVGSLQINFFNTVVGPFSPSLYAPPNKVNPNLTCTNVTTSSLFLYAKKLLALSDLY